MSTKLTKQQLKRIIKEEVRKALMKEDTTRVWDAQSAADELTGYGMFAPHADSAEDAYNELVRDGAIDQDDPRGRKWAAEAWEMIENDTYYPGA